MSRREGTETGPRWESSNPGKGCNSTHVARSRRWWKRHSARALRRTGHSSKHRSPRWIGESMGNETEEVRWCWVRFWSPGNDPRPTTVPAPCQWWQTGERFKNNVPDVSICAHVRVAAHKGVGDIREALEAYWPGLTMDFVETIGPKPPDNGRFPTKPEGPDGYVTVTL